MIMIPARYGPRTKNWNYLAHRILPHIISLPRVPMINISVWIYQHLVNVLIVGKHDFFKELSARTVLLRAQGSALFYTA